MLKAFQSTPVKVYVRTRNNVSLLFFGVIFQSFVVDVVETKKSTSFFIDGLCEEQMIICLAYKVRNKDHGAMVQSLTSRSCRPLDGRFTTIRSMPKLSSITPVVTGCHQQLRYGSRGTMFAKG